MKIKFLRYALLVPIAAIMVTGCSNFDEINTNPNAATQVSSGMLATSMILSITRSDISSTKTFIQPSLLGKYMTWNEGGPTDFQYNKLGRTNFNRITLLRNIKPMIDFAPNEGLKKSYTGLGHFIRAWQFFQTTMQVGDIPYSDAVKGETDAIIKPKYDSQKAVFLGILNELDQANILFSEGTNFDGDPIYAGKVDNWRRLTNSFQLHVLLQLYKKTADTDLKVVTRFNDIVANRPLMRDYKDNFALTYNVTAGQNYPWSSVPAGSNPYVLSKYSMLSTTLINTLKTLQDNRLFYYAKPSPVKITAGFLASDWNAYVGAEPSNSITSLGAMRGTKDYSDINNRYVDLVNAEPVSVFSFQQLQFVLAEAAVRGWISTPAQTYYAAGITNAMKFTAAYTPDIADYHHNMKITDANIATYIANVALTGTNENQISQIITQKYLAGFFHGGSTYSAWFENRRTGYPVFILNPSTNLNNPTTNFPLRWLYPSNELDYNTENMNAAVASQYGGNDNVNQMMWLLKD
ncbi:MULTISPECIES: SusD/RagB family nutrient-binding outer membrane lipoprotein [Flavobacterium]|uniref:SusD/RagB family nutrient-binding outer membrane lipoprotein n=1 Tax=Flavobacterium ranwuense TaxID=2541725 RepID=A0ABY2DQD2_9FLAO|nr:MULTISPECIES: SusD/RagB family nutrient-binding outer membrane lipoprotein [Flavobacterium]TDE28220.1 SusD/RagB family nutrient-binding outer membrane lipoprotein [Flavobacterium ranwuense]TDE49080.1 SusD/RagB family nutrient-binding outer membrane lipoprotein [Flavobacterium sp. GT3P67]